MEERAGREKKETEERRNGDASEENEAGLSRFGSFSSRFGLHGNVITFWASEGRVWYDQTHPPRRRQWHHPPWHFQRLRPSYEWDSHRQGMYFCWFISFHTSWTKSNPVFFLNRLSFIDFRFWSFWVSINSHVEFLILKRFDFIKFEEIFLFLLWATQEIIPNWWDEKFWALTLKASILGLPLYPFIFAANECFLMSDF